MKLRPSFAALAALTLSASAYGQPIISDNGDLSLVADRLVNDPLVTLNSASITVASASGDISTQSALYNGLTGFEDGVVLSTGDVNDVPGPNAFPDTTTQVGGGTFPLLEGLTGTMMSDAIWLSITFTPNLNYAMSMKLGFASEEYFAGIPSLNDAVGVWVNGVLVQDIQAINYDFTSPAFTDNSNGLELEGNGLVGFNSGFEIYANAILNEGVENTVTIAIADGGFGQFPDDTFDSAVFIEPIVFTQVPEASTYGFIGALALLGLVVARRLRK